MASDQAKGTGEGRVRGREREKVGVVGEEGWEGDTQADGDDTKVGSGRRSLVHPTTGNEVSDRTSRGPIAHRRVRAEHGCESTVRETRSACGADKERLGDGTVSE